MSEQSVLKEFSARILKSRTQISEANNQVENLKKEALKLKNELK